MNILKIILDNVFCNETLSNLENFLQRNLTTERARKSIFWVSGGTNFGSFSRRLHGFEVCTSLPKKSLDTSLLWFSYVFLCKKGTLAWNRRLMLWTNTNSCYNTSLFANEKKKRYSRKIYLLNWLTVQVSIPESSDATRNPLGNDVTTVSGTL